MENDIKVIWQCAFCGAKFEQSKHALFANCPECESHVKNPTLFPILPFNDVLNSDGTIKPTPNGAKTTGFTLDVEYTIKDVDHIVRLLRSIADNLAEGHHGGIYPKWQLNIRREQKGV